MKPATDHRYYCSFALLQPLFQHLNRSTFLFLNKHLYFYEFSQAILCFISLSSSYTHIHTIQRRGTHPHTKNFNCVRQRPTKFIMDMNVAFHSNLLLIHFLFFSSFFFFMPLKCSFTFESRGEYEQDFTISIGYFPFTDCTVSRNGPFTRLLIYYERMVLVVNVTDR